MIRTALQTLRDNLPFFLPIWLLAGLTEVFPPLAEALLFLILPPVVMQASLRMVLI